MNDNDCITCYAKILVHIEGEEVETCHRCLVRGYDGDQRERLHEIIDDYEYYSGICELCHDYKSCAITRVKLCHEHNLLIK